MRYRIHSLYYYYTLNIMLLFMNEYIQNIKHLRQRVLLNQLHLDHLASSHLSFTGVEYHTPALAQPQLTLENHPYSVRVRTRGTVPRRVHSHMPPTVIPSDKFKRHRSEGLVYSFTEKRARLQGEKSPGSRTTHSLTLSRHSMKRVTSVYHLSLTITSRIYPIPIPLHEITSFGTPSHL